MGKMCIIMVLIAIGGIGCGKPASDGYVLNSDSNANDSEIMAEENESTEDNEFNDNNESTEDDESTEDEVKTCYLMENDMLVPYRDIIITLREKTGNIVSTSFCFFDITQDGEPELWLLNGSCEADKMLYVYTLRDDKPFLIYEGSGGHSDFFEYRGNVVGDMSNCGAGTVSEYKYDKNRGKIRTKSINYSLFNEEGIPEAGNKRKQRQLDEWLNNLGPSLDFITVEMR